MRRFLYRVLEQLGPFYDVTVDGAKLRCRVNDNNTETRAIVHAAAGTAELRRVMADLKPGDVFVDIGANCGLFTVSAARAVGPTGRVLAIEPSPVMLERLRFNIDLNGLDNVLMVADAVGDANGSTTLHIPMRQYGRASVIEAAARDRRRPSNLVGVPVETLHALVVANGLTRIDILKIDIEGYEDRALLPFFAEAPPDLWPTSVFIETAHRNHWRVDCCARLRELGYVTKWQTGRDAMLVKAAN